MNLSSKKNSLKGLLVVLLGISANVNVTAKTLDFAEHTNPRMKDSLTNENFITQSAAISMKELLAANLAVEKGGSEKVKSMGRLMVNRLSQVNEEIRVLAKLKKVALATTTTAGGQRPDGRIDSAPENLQDTSRIKNAGGEAGNTGQATSKSNQMSPTVITKSIDNLRGLSGAAFDKAYREMVMEDHALATSLLQKGSKSGDKDVKAFANKYLVMMKNANSYLKK